MKKMLELAHVHIRMGSGEERYTEVLSENFDLNIYYSTHTLTANTHLYLSLCITFSFHILHSLMDRYCSNVQRKIPEMHVLYADTVC